MKRIVYTRNGVVEVVQPTISRDDPVGFSEEEAVQRALIKDVPADALDVRVVDASAVPADRSKRAGWRLNGAVIEVDDAKYAAARDAQAARAIDAMDRLQFEHLFDLENRTRILELKTQITRAQYRQALIDKWKTLNP